MSSHNDSAVVNKTKSFHRILSFEITQDELTENWFYEFKSPYFDIGRSSNDSFCVSVVSEFGEGSEFSVKKPGIYVRFVYVDADKRQYCLRQVSCSVISKPELGAIDFKINHTGSEVIELWHPKFFSLCNLRTACEENGGLINLCFDVEHAAYSQQSGGDRDSEILSRMNSFAISGDYTDATLKVRDREYRAHRVVLASCSDVFNATFQTDMQEKETGIIKLADELRDEVVKAFLQYVYTRQVDNLPGVVHDLYAMAHLYDTRGLLDHCETSLYAIINESNVVKTLVLAEKYSLTHLARKAKDYIRDNFAVISKQMDYVEYLTARLSLLNAVKNLLLSDDHKMKYFKERVIAYIAQNFTHLVKDNKYKALYKTHPNLILQVDEYIAKHFLLPLSDEKVH